MELGRLEEGRKSKHASSRTSNVVTVALGAATIFVIGILVWTIVLTGARVRTSGRELDTFHDFPVVQFTSRQGMDLKASSDEPFWLWGDSAVREFDEDNDKMAAEAKARNISAISISQFHRKWSGVTQEGMVWSSLKSSQPRIIYGHSTLALDECDRLVDRVRSRLIRSNVNGGVHGEAVQSQSRTSQGTFLVGDGDMKFDVNVKLRTKIASLMGLPEVNAEATQILRYGGGQQYLPHLDSFKASNVATMKRGGQRLASAITWLNDVSLGGETKFPAAVQDPGGPRQTGFTVAPRKGDTILFYDLQEDWSIDQTSLHGGDPPAEGQEKFVAVLWFHPRVFH